MTIQNAPSPVLLLIIVLLVSAFVVGGMMMIYSSRLMIIEEIRAFKLRIMHRPASIKGKTRTNKIG